MTFKSLSLTHAVYDEDSHLSRLIAWSSLVPVFGTVFIAGVAAARRELITVLLLLGIVFNEILNAFLKEIVFGQNRPTDQDTPAAHTEQHGKFGMPSSHAQWVGYFSTVSILMLLYRITLRHMSSVFVKFICFCGLILGAFVCYGRVFSGYHTTHQILVGLLVGSFFGITWFHFSNYITSGNIGQKLIDHSICKFFLIKDSGHIDDVLYFEYKISKSQKCTEISKRKGI